MKLLINLGVWAVCARSTDLALCQIEYRPFAGAVDDGAGSAERVLPRFSTFAESRDYRVCYIPRVCVSRRKRITEAVLRRSKRETAENC